MRTLEEARDTPPETRTAITRAINTESCYATWANGHVRD